MNDQVTVSIAFGFCQCGCGEKTNLSTVTRSREGLVKGQPRRFLVNHDKRNSPPCLPSNPLGLCLCGCGEKTKLASETSTKYGWVKGHPHRFLKGHKEKKPFLNPYPNPLGECLCGCGQKTKLVQGQPRRFLYGHGCRRENHPSWKGGRSLSSHKNGPYVLIYQPDHPNADGNGRVLEHVLKASLALGKPIPPGVIVHHVNEITTDNRNTNLLICSQGYHHLLHARMRALRACGNPSWRKCQYCQTWDSPDHLVINKKSSSVRHRACHTKSEYNRKQQRKAA